MPYSNSQAPALEHSNSISRCVAIITASIFVLLSTAYYQTLLLSSLVVKNSIQPLSVEALLNRIETNQSRVMFILENYEPEQTIRDSNTSGLAAALLINPPIFASDFAGRRLINFNMTEVLTENPIMFILTEQEARRTWESCGSNKDNQSPMHHQLRVHLSIILCCFSCGINDLLYSTFIALDYLMPILPPHCFNFHVTIIDGIVTFVADKNMLGLSQKSRKG